MWSLFDGHERKKKKKKKKAGKKKKGVETINTRHIYIFERQLLDSKWAPITRYKVRIRGSTANTLGFNAV